MHSLLAFSQSVRFEDFKRQERLEKRLSSKAWKKILYFYSPNSTENAKYSSFLPYKICPPIYLSEMVFTVEYLRRKSSKLHFSAEFFILEKLKIVWKALYSLR